MVMKMKSKEQITVHLSINRLQDKDRKSKREGMKEFSWQLLQVEWKHFFKEKM